MAHGRNKCQSRESRAKIRQILMDSWDPIGVRDVPEAQDEYDRYVGEVYVMLMDQRATEQAIASHLFDIAVNHMCLPDRPRLAESSARTAALLVDLRPNFETH